MCNFVCNNRPLCTLCVRSGCRQTPSTLMCSYTNLPLVYSLCVSLGCNCSWLECACNNRPSCEHAQHICTQKHTAPPHTHTRTHTHTCAHIHTYTLCTYTHTYTICMYTHTHTYTHAVHTQPLYVISGCRYRHLRAPKPQGPTKREAQGRHHTGKALFINALLYLKAHFTNALLYLEAHFINALLFLKAQDPDVPDRLAMTCVFDLPCKIRRLIPITMTAHTHTHTQTHTHTHTHAHQVIVY